MTRRWWAAFVCPVLRAAVGSTASTVDFQSSFAGRRWNDIEAPSYGEVRPPEVPGFGAQVLLPLLGERQPQCGATDSTERRGNSVLAGEPIAERSARWRRDFVCTAACSEREPELEQSLSPWDDWATQGNRSGLHMLDLMNDFCHAPRSCQDPFVMVALWRGDVYLKACRAERLQDPRLYLIGPEDLSMVITFLLAVQRVAALPRGPVVFSLYLSDYTCLADRHLVGPGVPIFAYLRRDTSWVIPWPSSFALFSTYELEERQGRTRAGHVVQRAAPPVQPPDPPWSKKTPRAYWIGTVTGPWEVQADDALGAIPRIKLLKLAAENRAQLKAEWTGVATYGIRWIRNSTHIQGLNASSGPHSIEGMTGARKVRAKTVDKWAHFKYYLNLDGVVMGGRQNKLLALGGVLLQHEAGYKEHTSALLKAYEHYVPIAYDLSDLVPKVKWLQREDAEAERIARRGQELALRRMRLEDDLCYVWRALEALGAKTAPAEADPTAVERRLKELHFTRVTLRGDSMRETLESFWGAPLEDVSLGSRQITPLGIQLLRWAWERFAGLSTKAHGNSTSKPWLS